MSVGGELYANNKFHTHTKQNYKRLFKGQFN